MMLFCKALNFLLLQRKNNNIISECEFSIEDHSCRPHAFVYHLFLCLLKVLFFPVIQNVSVFKGKEIV